MIKLDSDLCVNSFKKSSKVPNSANTQPCLITGLGSSESPSCAATREKWTACALPFPILSLALCTQDTPKSASCPQKDKDSNIPQTSVVLATSPGASPHSVGSTTSSTKYRSEQAETGSAKNTGPIWRTGRASQPSNPALNLAFLLTHCVCLDRFCPCSVPE